MHHVIFSPLLDTNCSEKPVIGVLCCCLAGFFLLLHTRWRLEFLSCYFCLKELYFSLLFWWRQQAKTEPLKHNPEMKNAEEFRFSQLVGLKSSQNDASALCGQNRIRYKTFSNLMQEFHFDPERVASGLHFLQKYFQTETWSGRGAGGAGLPC